MLKKNVLRAQRAEKIFFQTGPQENIPEVIRIIKRNYEILKAMSRLDRMK